MPLMHNPVAEQPVNLSYFTGKISQQVNDMGGLFRKLSAGLLLITPPGYARHVAHPLSDDHAYLIAFQRRLQPLDILLIPEVIADRGQQIMLFDILQEAGRNFRARSQRLLN
ncbi:hypothetical protein D3C81_2047890 [compost metagenome]